MSSHPEPARWAIAAPIAAGDVPGLCARLRRRLLARGGAEVVACDVAALGADAMTVDALARLALTARRLGCRIRLEDASPELAALLAFFGLELALGAGRAGLALGPGAQPEEREQPGGVEERVDRGDATV